MLSERMKASYFINHIISGFNQLIMCFLDLIWALQAVVGPWISRGIVHRRPGDSGFLRSTLFRCQQFFVQGARTSASTMATVLEANIPGIDGVLEREGGYA